MAKGQRAAPARSSTKARAGAALRRPDAARPPDDGVRDAVRDAGVQVRRDMFGAELTDGQIADANAFTRPLQDVVSRYCFGETWTREGLGRRERSIVTLAVLCAMGRAREIEVHVRGALANGVTPLEIRELLQHAMVYCGVPLGVEAFRHAAEALTRAGVDLDTLAPVGYGAPAPAPAPAATANATAAAGKAK